MRSDLTIELRRARNGEVTAHGALAAAPWWCRWDGGTLWMVGSAATPVGDDEISLTVELGADVTATVRGVAASVVYTARGDGTRTRTTVRVGPGATLRWQPEPVIVTARARHRAHTVVEVAHGGAVLLDETVVMGRSDERPGSFTTTLELHRDAEPVSLTSFDTSVPGWDGPGGTGGAKVVATRLVVDPLDALAPVPTSPTVDRSTVVLRPEGGGAIATTLADDPWTATVRLDAALVLGAG